MRTTLFHIRPTTPNIGNDLIAIGLESFMHKAFAGDLNLVTIPAVAQESRIKGSGLSPRNIYEINQLADGLMIGPGNLFENGGLNCDAAALSVLRVPTMLFSVSSGRVYDRSGRLVPRTDSLSRDKIEAICQRADPILVRDRATAAHLEKLGIDRVQIGGCPALFLDPQALPLPPVDPNLADGVLISVRHPNLMSVPYLQQGRVRLELRRIIDMVRQRQAGRPYILCHDYQDLSFAQEFPDVPLLYTEDPYRFLGWLRDCRLNITFRLHAFFPCLAIGTPSIHLSYDERAISLIETAGLGAWDVNFIHTADLLGEIEQRMDTLPRLQELKQQAQPTWNELYSVMSQGTAAFAARVAAARQWASPVLWEKGAA